MHTPGLKIVMPSNAYDAKGLLKTSIRDDNPVLFIEHKLLYGVKGDVPQEEYLLPFGKAAVRRDGRDATVVATSRMVNLALAAGDELASEGIEIEVIDPRTLVPLDLETIVNSVKKTGRLVVVHEAVRTCGVGAEIGMQVCEAAFDYLDAPVVRIGALDVPVPCTPVLENAVLPQKEDIVSGVKQVLR